MENRKSKINISKVTNTVNETFAAGVAFGVLGTGTKSPIEDSMDDGGSLSVLLI